MSGVAGRAPSRTIQEHASTTRREPLPASPFEGGAYFFAFAAAVVVCVRVCVCACVRVCVCVCVRVVQRVRCRGSSPVADYPFFFAFAAAVVCVRVCACVRVCV